MSNRDLLDIIETTLRSIISSISLFVYIASLDFTFIVVLLEFHLLLG